MADNEQGSTQDQQTGTDAVQQQLDPSQDAAGSAPAGGDAPAAGDNTGTGETSTNADTATSNAAVDTGTSAASDDAAAGADAKATAAESSAAMAGTDAAAGSADQSQGAAAAPSPAPAPEDKPTDPAVTPAPAADVSAAPAADAAQSATAAPAPAPAAADASAAAVPAADQSSVGDVTKEADQATAAPAPAPAPAPVPARGQATSYTHIDEQGSAVVPGPVDGNFWEGHDLDQHSVSWMLNLKNYMEAMNPRRPMDVRQGVSHQKSLYRLFMWIINTSPDADFEKLMMLMLEQFYAHRDGVFHETAVGRFPEHLTMTKDESRTFFNLINLFKILTDKKGGQLRYKQLDMNKTLTHLITEKGKQRLLNLIEG